LGLPFLPFLGTLVALSVSFTWLHNQTGGSIWTAIFFHWIYTCAGQVIFSAVSEYPSFHWYAMIPYVLIAIAVAFLWIGQKKVLHMDGSLDGHLADRQGHKS
jgi:hypothetical protein